MTDFRVLVCGGRDFKGFDNQAALWEALDRIHRLREIRFIIHGAARGADSMGMAWARDRGVAVLTFPVTPADWSFHGKRAGHLRNATMLREGRPNLVLAAPGGPGTRNMVGQAKEAGVLVLRLIAPG